MPCGSEWEAAVLGLCPDDCGGVAVAHVNAGGGGLCLVGEVGGLSGSSVRSTTPRMAMVLRTTWSWAVACPPRSAGVGLVLISPMMMVQASMAIWRYASARA